MTDSTTKPEKYLYDKLDDPSRWIRLVRILSPADIKTKRPLNCTLEAVPFDGREGKQNFRYDCLSYTWGDPLFHNLSTDDAPDPKMTNIRDQTILCDGRTIQVTQNLAEALDELCQHGYGPGDENRAPIWQVAQLSNY